MKGKHSVQENAEWILDILLAINNCLDMSALNHLNNLVEKDRSTKPELISDGDYDGEPVYDMWKCPNCGKLYEIDYDIYDYCPNCGQHIDRSEMGD